MNISTNFLSFWQGGSSRSGDIAEFMSYLTCLTVSVESKSSLETSYHCRVGDGLLTGRKKISVCMYVFFFCRPRTVYFSWFTHRELVSATA